MYRTANQHYQQKFGCKVYKLSIDAGFTCPNRDGTLGTGGCIYCSGDGGGEFAEKEGSDVIQLRFFSAPYSVTGKLGTYSHAHYHEKDVSAEDEYPEINSICGSRRDSEDINACRHHRYGKCIDDVEQQGFRA